MYVQSQVTQISRFNNPEGIPESSCSTCLETLVARTAELLEKLEREHRCRVRRGRYSRRLPEFRTAVVLQPVK